MYISKIEISGLRGFATKEKIALAIPNDAISGSGLNIIVGPNNAGKSTIIEAFNSFTNNDPPSFTEGKRNVNTGKLIEITLTHTESQHLILKTIQAGGSETEFVINGIFPGSIKPFIVPSRRTFSPYFSKAKWDRNSAIMNYRLPATRGLGYNNFAYRLFEIQSNPLDFNRLLKKVLGFQPNWNIEQSDNGEYYLKFIFDNSEHNSDGAGEGFLSIFTIIDALYDSKEGDLIIIDEPELSLHPSLQKKLANLLIEESKHRQIIISTHSPYFIDWNTIVNGAKIIRVSKEKNQSKIHQLTKKSVDAVGKNYKNLNNPHVYGLNASEVFFLDENVVLVEGQEDVVIYKKILKDIGLDINGDFFGWGVGGADNMENIALILSDLGFKKVVGILDHNKSDLVKILSEKFPNYFFTSIPTDDIRDKKERKATEEVIGLTTSDGKIKDKYLEDFYKLFAEINAKFN